MIQTSSNIESTAKSSNNNTKQQQEMKLDKSDSGGGNGSTTNIENWATSNNRQSSASSFDLSTMVDITGVYTGGINQVEPHRALDSSSHGGVPGGTEHSNHHSSHHHRHHSGGGGGSSRRGTPPPNSSPRHSQAQIKRSSTVLNEELKEDVEEEAREEAEDRKMSNPAVGFNIAADDNYEAENNNADNSINRENKSAATTSAASRAVPIIPNGGPLLQPTTSGNNNNNNNYNTTNTTTTTTTTTNDLFVASTHAKNYTIEYSFKKIKAAYLIDSKDFLEYLKLLVLFFLNLLVFFPLIVFISAIFMPYKFILRLFYKMLHMCHLTRTSHISPNKMPEFLHPTELFWLYNSGLQENSTGGIEMTHSPDVNGGGGSSNAAGVASAGAGGVGSFHSKSSCLFLLDGCISKNKLKELIKNRIVETTVANKFERFTQRIMSLRSLGFIWIRCATFDLDEHIIEIDNSMDFVSNEEMQSYLSNLISRHKFDLSKPLWSVYYKQTVNRKTERSTMVLFISHQSFSDGVSLMRLFLRGLVDNRNQLDVKPRFAYSVLRRNQIKQLIFGWSSLFYKLFFRHHPAKNESAHLRRRSTANTTTAAAAAATTSTNPHHTPGQNVLVWSDSFDLMHLNRLKLITRSRMNDFLISIVGGILRHYLQHKGINNPHNLRCLMPVDLNSNKYPMKMEARKSALCSFELPVKIEGCVPRLWATKLATQSVKSSSDFLLIHFLIRVLFRIFPNRFAYRCVRSILNENTCVVSTLGCGDSSLATVSISNQSVKNIIYFYPTVASVSVSFSIITYGDEVRLAMLADNGVINNPEFITKQFIKQLKILSDLLSNRRIPGEIKKGQRPPVDFDHLYSHPLMDVNQMDDYAVNDMQIKMTQIQQELQQLTESMEKLDTTSGDYNKKKQVILIKSEKLRKEFSRILADMQSRSNQISQALPSDDEDELEPDERIRLRSASVASRVSSASHSRRLLRDSHSEHSNVDKQISSRKASLAQNSRHGSLSYSSGNSHSREFSHHATSNQNLHNLNTNANHHHASISIENEINRSSRRSTDHS